MDKNCKKIIWGQFGAAIDTLENAINACPEKLWYDSSGNHQYWYIVSHTLFWLDYYLTEPEKEFAPPEPFGLEELDPAGVIPDPPYSKELLLKYLEYGRDKCRSVIESMTEELSLQERQFRKANLTFDELLLYIMRHVQHHAAQLNLILRQAIDSSPGWVFRAKE